MHLKKEKMKEPIARDRARPGKHGNGKRDTWWWFYRTKTVSLNLKRDGRKRAC